MSFKKGDRVRIVRSMGEWDALGEAWVGVEGVITGLASGPEWDYEVEASHPGDDPNWLSTVSVYEGEIEAA